MYLIGTDASVTDDIPHWCNFLMGTTGMIGGGGGGSELMDRWGVPF